MLMSNDDELEKVRYHLNKMIISCKYSTEELLKVSQKLDLLILESMKEKAGVTDVILVEDEMMSEWENILDKLQVFEKMYEVMRIVDPVNKKVQQVKKGQVDVGENTCYEYWKDQRFCDNCISMRAYNEDDTFFKIVQKEDRIFMVTAVPMVIKGKRLVVELLKETKDHLLVSDIQGENMKLFTLIDHMNKAVVKDALTDSYNRRYINERLPAELFNASIKKEPLSIIFADIDFFKKINDTFGHKVGDLVLKEFAKELEAQIGSDQEWVARYGGEEFILCFPNTNKQTAMRKAEQIRSCIESKEFVVEKNLIHMTCSFGVYTVCNETECLTAEGIIDILDKRLYRAKKKGRNTVEGERNDFVIGK